MLWDAVTAGSAWLTRRHQCRGITAADGNPGWALSKPKHSKENTRTSLLAKARARISHPRVPAPAFQSLLLLADK